MSWLSSPGDRIVDLYAGVGLFSVALAARGSDVVAVEGDPSSGADLEANAAPWQDRLHVLRTSVEDAVRDGPDEAPDVVIVDPPRTGLSAEAAAGISQWAAARIVYVSCDPPTLARDSAKLTSAGYTLDSTRGVRSLSEHAARREHCCLLEVRGEKRLKYGWSALEVRVTGA